MKKYKLLAYKLSPAWPYLLLLLGILWKWRVSNIFEQVPAYGDILEIIWGLKWITRTVGSGESLIHHPLTYYPSGWDLRSFPPGAGLFLILLPFERIGGATFALNMGGILALAIGFVGMYKLTLRFTPQLPAVVVAFLFAFWDFRFLYHLNIFLPSSLIPWMVLCLDKGMYSTKRSQMWYVFAGIFWALASSMQLYFLFLGGITLFLWGLGSWLSTQVSRRIAFQAVFTSLLVGLAFSIPSIMMFKSSTSLGVSAFDVTHIHNWSASINSITIPSLRYNQMRNIISYIYSGPSFEGSLSNIGLISSLILLIGVWFIPQKKRFYPLFLLTIIGFTLALGPFLKWNNGILHVDEFRFLNQIIWQIGHILKPQVFLTSVPSPAFETAIPLPELALLLSVPFWEGFRTVSRFALIGGFGFYLLLAVILTQIRQKWIQILLASLLIFEGISSPVSNGGVPVETKLHPAYAWLEEQPVDGSIIDMWVPRDNTLSLKQGASILWATDFHGIPTVSGAGSILPAQTFFLKHWLESAPFSLIDADFINIMRSYDVKYIYLHMSNQLGDELLSVLQEETHEDVQLVDCFQPPETITPWPYSICVIEIFSSDEDGVPLYFHNGWGGKEEWGQWGTDEASLVEWIALPEQNYELALKMFPYCIENKPQHIDIRLNGNIISTYDWNDCDEYQTTLPIAASDIDTGWNRIIFEYGTTYNPAEITDNTNLDTRNLSVGFNQLTVYPVSMDIK